MAVRTWFPGTSVPRKSSFPHPGSIRPSRGRPSSSTVPSSRSNRAGSGPSVTTTSSGSGIFTCCASSASSSSAGERVGAFAPSASTGSIQQAHGSRGRITWPGGCHTLEVDLHSQLHHPPRWDGEEIRGGAGVLGDDPEEHLSPVGHVAPVSYTHLRAHETP